MTGFTFDVRHNKTLAAAILLLTGCAVVQTTAYFEEKNRENAHLVEALRNGKTLYNAALQFAGEKGHFPNAATWEKDIKPYLPANFAFSIKGTPVTRFAYNPRFSNKKLDFMGGANTQVALFFESRAAQSAPHDDFTSLAAGKNSSQAYFVLVQSSGGVYSYPNEYAQLINDPKTRAEIVGK